ncbi:MAG: hypothetical protein ACE5LU_03050 [Anaerolineae bacterium]
MSASTEEIIALLQSCTPEQRRRIFRELRKEFSIHPLEEELSIRAEIILEAIARAGGLTLRMIRGVIAEVAFKIEVIEKLEGWKDITPEGNLPYDFKLDDGNGPVTIQVKLQRSKGGRPARAHEGYVRFSQDMYLIEPQKTRKGEMAGESTRLYRFGEFDILAASMQPSTNDWSSFMYTVGDWLLPDTRDKSRVLKFQPIPMEPNDDWTDDFETCVRWLRSREQKRIRDTPTQ